MKNWPKACFGQKFWETRIQNVLDKKQNSKVLVQKSQFVIIWLKKLENNQNVADKEKSTFWRNFEIWSILVVSVFIDHNSIWLETGPLNQNIFGQFGPE